jgi:hypothetical protein
MTAAERFRQVRNLFDAAMDRAAADRDLYLADACQGDPDLLAEVHALLDAQARPQTWIDTPPAAPPRMEGRRIGPYEILREIAAGGMGTVYLARRADGAFDMHLAVKVLRPEAATPEVLSRFRQERRILAALDHPNIARILDGGETPEGLPYLAMEFVDGLPIDRYCAEHRLDTAARLGLFRAVCAAVRYAHAQGVVHRDLKPSNILVTADGVPKLLDFGIAKLLAAGAEQPTACVTRSGLWLMTPEYASPEQVRGEPAGPPSDVYSLGVLLYELLTGQRPYRLRTRGFHEVVRVICEEPPTRPGGLARGLDAVVLKALGKRPAERYGSVEGFDADVERYLAGRPVEARRPTPLETARSAARRHPAWIVGAVFAIGLWTAGFVRIQMEFVAMLGALVLVALSTVAIIRAEAGGDVARRIGKVSALTVFGFGLGGVLLVFSIPQRIRPNFITVLDSLLVVAYLFQVLRWLFRDRWAGRLLVNASRPTPRWIYALWILFPLGIGARLLRSAPMSWDAVAGFGMGAAIALWLSIVYGRLELRERGVLCNGQRLPWNRIETHSWEDTAGAHHLLHLQLGGWRRHFPFSALLVPAHLKPEVEAVLDRYLREWPPA